MVTGSRIEIAEPFVDHEEWEATRACFETGWMTQGPRVQEFESAFAARHGVAHGVATTSCTTALHLALHVLGVGPGDEVIVPAFTWVATANVVKYCGATPVFIDVERDSFNLDPAQLPSKLTDRTKAVIAVHLFGLCADVPAIRKALPSSVAIVEDAACAAGSTWAGRPAGSLGTIGAFSFHPRKVITTGEGGMLTTDDAELAARAVIARNHGASVSEESRHHGPRPHILPDFDVLGFNYRMTDMQGAIGVVQLGRLDALIERRQQLARFYDDALAEIPWLRGPVSAPDALHTYQSYVCVVDENSAPGTRNDLMERLLERGISTRPGTHAPVDLGLYRTPSTAECTVALRLERETMAIPLHNRMTDSDAARVVEELAAL